MVTGNDIKFAVQCELPELRNRPHVFPEPCFSQIQFCYVSDFN